MSYSVQEFEKNNLILFEGLKEINHKKKLLEEQEKQAKAALLEQMLKHEIKSIDNEFVKVTVTKASESTSIDLKAFQKQEPVAYAELLEDYPKVTKRSESLRVVFK